MKSQAITSNFQEANVEALAVAVFKNEKATDGLLKELNDLSGGLVAQVIKDEDYKGDVGETALIRIVPNGKVKARSILLVGVGERTDYQTFAVAAVAGGAARFLRKRNVKSFALAPRSEDSEVEVAKCAMQGVVMQSIRH